MKLIGVFSRQNIRFSELVRCLPFCNVTKEEFGFMPYWPDVDYTMEEYETDPAFVKGLSCDLGAFKFPELSVTGFNEKAALTHFQRLSFSMGDLRV